MRGKVIYNSDGEARYFFNDEEVTQEEYDARFPSRLEYGEDAEAPLVSASAWHDNLQSRALAVHKSQVEEANAWNKKTGIATRYDKTGMAHIPTRGDRSKLLKRDGMHDNDGGYSDR